MFFNSKSLYLICALVVFLFAAFACSPSGNEIQLSKQDSLVLHSDFSDTIYAENSMLVFKNGNLESVVLQDEFKNKFQRIQLNSENGLFGVYNLVDHDTLDNLYYDYLEFSRKDDVDKDTKPLFFS